MTQSCTNYATDQCLAALHMMNNIHIPLLFLVFYVNLLLRLFELLAQRLFNAELGIDVLLLFQVRLLLA